MPDLRKLFLGFGWFSHAGPLSGVGNLLDAFRVDVLAGCRNGETVDSTILVADDQALLVVHAHRDPRTLFFHGHGIEQIDLETVGQIDPGG